MHPNVPYTFFPSITPDDFTPQWKRSQQLNELMG